jgi:glycosyltransferase involved in cell wall biosynthesis
MPLLSVHLITYNNKKHIQETIQSILKQKVDFDYEIVIGDDCSSDNTFEILQEYKKKHTNLIKLKRNNLNLGILKNFKSTLDRCSGTYVFDIAGDDYLNNDHALQKMVNTFRDNHEIGFIDCGYDRLDDATKKVTPFKNKDVINDSKETYRNKLLLGKIAPIGHCFKKESIYKYVNFETYLKKGISIEDYPILVNMVMNADFVLLNESLVTYRVHDHSYSHQKNLNNIVSQKEEMLWLFNHFSKKYSFPEALKQIYYQNHFRSLLFTAGYFQNGTLGKDAFKKVKKKSLKDYIHFWASQNKLFRRFISLRKKII